MATYKEIEQELKDAKAEYGKAVKKLEEWEQRKYGGEKLNELEEELIVGNFNEAERGKREGWRNRLLRQRKVGEECGRLEEAGGISATRINKIQWRGR